MSRRERVEHTEDWDVVSKELVYPSLEAEVVGRLPLASR
jgi:hypothetical protein